MIDLFLSSGDLPDKQLQDDYTTKFKKELKQGKWIKLKREMRNYLFRFLYNLIIRFKGISYLKKHNLF